MFHKLKFIVMDLSKLTALNAKSTKNLAISKQVIGSLLNRVGTISTLAKGDTIEFPSEISLAAHTIVPSVVNGVAFLQVSVLRNGEAINISVGSLSRAYNDSESGVTVTPLDLLTDQADKAKAVATLFADDSVENALQQLQGKTCLVKEHQAFESTNRDGSPRRVNVYGIVTE